MKMKIEQLKEYVLNHPDLVTMKESVTYPGLFVLKYKKKVFFDSLWNRYLEKCRGLVVDKDFNIVVHPFDKIYNYGIEKDAPVLNDDELVLAVKKYNGFMAAVSKYNGEIIVSTTGSLDSDYAKLAREMILRSLTKDDFHENITDIFEICHPSDPHIIPEKQGIYVLGWRGNTDINSDINFASTIKRLSNREISDINYYKQHIYDTFDEEGYSSDQTIFYPSPTLTTLGELKERVKTIHHEGYIIYTTKGESLKIKSPYYLFLKFLARCSKTEKLFHKDAKKNLPEEFYPVIEHVQANIEEFALLDEQNRLEYVRGLIGNL